VQIDSVNSSASYIAKQGFEQPAENFLQTPYTSQCYIGVPPKYIYKALHRKKYNKAAQDRLRKKLFR
jgi:hypothetical protein